MPYKNVESFEKAMKYFLTKNGYGHVQTHDLRVSKATEMFG